MIALLLAKKIFSLFAVMFTGALLVRLKALKSSDSKILSVIALYLVMPCSVFTAFSVECTKEVLNGLLLAAVAAVLIHAVFLILNIFMKKPLGMDATERVSVLYPNAANLIIPIVTSIMGSEWVIYTSAFMTVQQLLFWTHCVSALNGSRSFSIKKFVTCPCIIAIFMGFLLFLFGIKMPAPLQDSVSMLGTMVGGMTSLIIGMLIGGLDLKTLTRYKRLWLVALLRLIVFPLIMLPLLKLGTNLTASAENVLLIVFMAIAAPSASSITSLAQVSGADADYASAINVITTVLCIVTMPLMVMLYGLI